MQAARGTCTKSRSQELSDEPQQLAPDAHRALDSPAVATATACEALHVVSMPAPRLEAWLPPTDPGDRGVDTARALTVDQAATTRLVPVGIGRRSTARGHGLPCNAMGDVFSTSSCPVRGAVCIPPTRSPLSGHFKAFFGAVNRRRRLGFPYRPNQAPSETISRALTGAHHRGEAGHPCGPLRRGPGWSPPAPLVSQDRTGSGTPRDAIEIRF
jgi:hypothetical protein